MNDAMTKEIHQYYKVNSTRVSESQYTSC